jgi:hypothetical protein
MLPVESIRKSWGESGRFRSVSEKSASGMEVTKRCAVKGLLLLPLAGGLFLVPVPAPAEQPAPDSKVYESRFGFTVGLPQGLAACIDDYTNDGVGVYLDPAVRCGRDDETHPQILIYGSYTAADGAANLQQIFKDHCVGQREIRVVVLSGFKLSGRRAVGCKIFRRDGTIDLSVATLLRTDPGNPLDWIEIGADLMTTPARFAADAAVFNKTLATLEIPPDGPRK